LLPEPPVIKAWLKKKMTYRERNGKMNLCAALAKTEEREILSLSPPCP
jgi:hypothetical protein